MLEGGKKKTTIDWFTFFEILLKENFRAIFLPEIKTAIMFCNFWVLPGKIRFISQLIFVILPLTILLHSACKRGGSFQKQNVIILGEILIHYSVIVLGFQLYCAIKDGIFDSQDYAKNKMFRKD